MSEPMYRVVWPAAALDGAPAGWAAEMLRDGEMAMTVDDGGLEAVDAVAHAMATPVVMLLRRETTDGEREATVREWAGSLALVWVAVDFGAEARAWARDRGPMTLLVESDGPLPDAERQRIARFVALLGRQAE